MKVNPLFFFTVIQMYCVFKEILYPIQFHRTNIWLIQSLLTDSVLYVVLNGHTSRSHHTNVGVTQVTILGPTPFLILINDLFDAISSQLGIYEYDTTTYNCLISKYGRHDYVNLISIDKDHQSLVNWDKEWLVNVSVSTTKLLSFNNPRESFLPVNMMMSFFNWLPDHMNLTVLRDWQLGFTVLLRNSLDEKVTSNITVYFSLLSPVKLPLGPMFPWSLQLYNFDASSTTHLL